MADAKIVKGVQSVPPEGRTGKGRVDGHFGVTESDRKTIKKVPTNYIPGQ